MFLAIAPLFFGEENKTVWYKMAKIAASKILDDKEIPPGTDNSAILYIKKLAELSGIKPKGGLFGKEKMGEFVERAYQTLATKRGALDTMRNWVESRSQ